MTIWSSDAKPGVRVHLAAAAGGIAMVLLASLPLRAEDANPVLAKVNGADIRQSDVALAEEELGPSLAQMDPATKKENVLAFLIDMKIVAKAAEDKKIEDRPEFKARLAFTRNRLLMDNLLATEGKAAAKYFGEEPHQQLDDDLRRLKQVLEAGEVVRSEGAPWGKRARQEFPQHPAQPLSSEERAEVLT